MQRFNKGDLLIQFDCSLYEAQKDVVSANANSALIKLKSDEQMLQMRSIGKYELELSISEYEKAKSELHIAELNVERCQIKAPFDGAVEEIVVNAFETIQPQVELMKIIQTDVLELEMVVSSEWISWLSIGHPIKVYIDEIQKEFSATVSGIGANVDPVSQTIQLKGTITETNPALLPGMSGRVLF
jgi:RND family efflux transporter MFP subunit